MEQVLSAPRSPWQRAYVERVISTLRRECLDHSIIFSEAALYRQLKTFATYYHGSRMHLSLSKDSPEPRAVPESVHAEETDIGNAKAGVHHHPNEVFQIVARIDLSVFKSVRPFDGSELVAGINDTLQFLVGVWGLVSNTIRAYRRLHVGTDRVFQLPFPIHAEPKESAQRTETFALGARAEIPVRIESVNIGKA